MSFCCTPRCLKGAIPEYYGYMNYYQLLPCFVYRILCVHSCVTHLLTNKAVLMELPHPSHPSHLVSGKHSSSIPHSCSPIDGLVHPNSWPFTPSSFLSLLQSPKLSFWHSWFLITVLFTIWHQKIVKGQLKAPSFSACTSTWTCPFPNRTISMPEPGSQKHQFYDIFYEIIAIARFLDVLMIWMIRMILLMGCPSPYLSESESADKMETSTLWGRSHLLGSLQFRNMSFVHEFFIPELKQKCCTPIYAVRTIIFP